MKEEGKVWKEGIQEYPFDFERYIEERLREINDLDERRFAKMVLLEGLGKAIQCMEEKYGQLQRRIYEELQLRGNRYETMMTIIEKQHYDPTNGTLFPVIPFDLDGFKGRERGFLGTVFLKMGWEDSRQFQETGTFSGVVWQMEQSRKAVFRVAPAERYRKRVEVLYQVFQDNQLPWSTVNTAYLDQFYDVFLVDVEENKELNFGEDDSIMKGFGLEECEIWFGKYSDFVYYGWIPLWNIEEISLESTNFMMPCIDGIYYEHVFVMDQRKEIDGYLIQGNEDIVEIRHEKDRILVKSSKDTFDKWKAFHMIQDIKTSLDYTEPFLSNRKQDSFFRRMAEESKVSLMTWMDLSRRILEMDIREYLDVTGYEICGPFGRNLEKSEIRESFVGNLSEGGMNWFIPESLFPMEERRILLLKFKAKKLKHYLNDGMIRFVVSQLQLEIGEYRCVGVLV